MLIEIEKIEVGERLRSRLDPGKLRLLADDMERNGQLQEIVVAIKWGMNNRGATIAEQATLIAGYRRLEAAKLLGWTQIRCTRQLGGDIDTESAVDLLRAEFSENEMRENFTEMERVAFGVKIKERIAVAARERMLSGKKLEYEYDPETGIKVWNEDDAEEADDAAEVDDGGGGDATDPTLNSVEGIDDTLQYGGGEVNAFVAQRIGMGKDKFRQGEYVLKHGTEEQRSAIDRGHASISGVYSELNPKPPKPAPMPLREQPSVPTTEAFTVKTSAHTESTEPKVELKTTLASSTIPPKYEPSKPIKRSEKTKDKRAIEALPPEVLETVEHVSDFTAMTSEQKITELSRLKDELHDAVYHRDGIIRNLERQLDAANARIKELEEKYEPDKYTS